MAERTIIDRLGQPFGRLAKADMEKLQIITQNEDIAIGDTFIIPSTRGRTRYFLFRANNYANRLRRTDDLDRIAATLISEPDAYLANLDNDQMLEVTGELLGDVTPRIGERNEDGFEFKRTRHLPEHFASVYRITRNEASALEQMLRNQLRGDLSIGQWLVGSEMLPINLTLPIDKVAHHLGIFGATGSGKSNLMMNLTLEGIDYNLRVILNPEEQSSRVSMFVIDPHDEYAIGSGTPSVGIQSVVDALEERNPQVRSELFRDWYYLTAHIGATHGNLHRYAQELRLSRYDVLPMDLESILSLTDPQVDYISGLHATHNDEWLLRIGEDLGTHTTAAIQASQRKLGFIDHSVVFGDRSRDTPGRSILCSIIEALEQGRVLVLNTSLMNEREQFLSVTVIARTIFELRKALKSSSDLQQLETQLRTRNVPNSVILELRNRNFIGTHYLSGTDQRTRRPEELCPILLTVEEAPSILTPRLMQSENNIYKAIARQGRKFGVGLCVISQQVSAIDFDLLTQLNTQIDLSLGNANEISAAIRAAHRDISRHETDFKILNRGEGVLSASYRDLPFVFRTPLFRTKANEFVASLDGRVDHDDQLPTEL